MARTSTTTAGGLSGFETMVLRLLALGAGSLILLSAIYFVWRLPNWLSGGTLAVAFGTGLYLIWRAHSELRLVRLTTPALPIISGLIALAADIIILIAYSLAATDEAIISPWQALPIGIFVLFAVATIYALHALAKLPGRYAVPLAILHSFATFGTAVLVYKLGFGFDPFIHEAATKYIVEYGAIEPKTPFYIGQYVLVAGFHNLTGLPIKDIQIWLVPTLASVLLPVILRLRGHRLALASAWLLPFGYLTFTVPFNLGFLALILIVLLLPYRTVNLGRSALILLAGAALAIHPLIGIPASALVIAAFFQRKILAGSLAFCLSGLGLFASLTAYAFLNGGSIIWPNFTQAWDTLNILFRPPFILLPEYPAWTALYLIYFLWPWAVVAFGTWKLRRAAERNALIGTALGSLVAAVTSAAVLRYRDIISHEQYEFAYRLLAILPWLFLPGIAAWLDELKPKLSTLAVLALGVTLAWHVAYPQLNPVMHFHSPGVSRTDVLLVQAMEAEAAGKTYAALAPQLTSAAALRLIGFERSIKTRDGSVYPYAIPTGGRLYQSYLELFLEDHDPFQALRETAEYAETELIYVAIPLSWDGNGALYETFINASASSRLIDESVWLYRFSTAELLDEKTKR